MTELPPQCSLCGKYVYLIEREEFEGTFYHSSNFSPFDCLEKARGGERGGEETRLRSRTRAGTISRERGSESSKKEISEETRQRANSRVQEMRSEMRNRTNTKLQTRQRTTTLGKEARQRTTTINKERSVTRGKGAANPPKPNKAVLEANKSKKETKEESKEEEGTGVRKRRGMSLLKELEEDITSSSLDAHYCVNCGTKFEEKAEFCSNCGAEQNIDFEIELDLDTI